MYGSTIESVEWKRVPITVSMEGDKLWVAADGISVSLATHEEVGDNFPFARSEWEIKRVQDRLKADMLNGVAINTQMGYVRTKRGLEIVSAVSEFAKKLADAIDAAHEPIIEAERLRVEAERAEREAERERRQAEYERVRQERYEQQRIERERRLEAERKRDEALAPRKEQMLNEFLDDEVKVGIHGYKSVVRGWVRVNQSVDGSFEPYIEFRYKNDRNRPSRIRDIKRLEIKDGSRFKLVWDDDDVKGIETTVKNDVEDY